MFADLELRSCMCCRSRCWRTMLAPGNSSQRTDSASLLAEFVRKPIACLTLASFLATNTGDVARKHIKDPELLSFIDIECYCWSTVLADFTPMMNAGMVFCDRHYGGINYPKGGVGRIAQALAGLKLIRDSDAFALVA